jgi:thioredoxin reductase (NADPH)
MIEKVIIIGSGPAGLTAAIYTARANLEPLCFAGIHAGGQLTTTTEVENYPGFPLGIMGPQLMEDFRKQAERFGARIHGVNVSRVDFSASPFKVWVEGGEERPHEARSVIIATGASARPIGLPNERALTGHGLSTCATCDGFFFKGKEIGVVGGGDSAMEEANFLTKFASKVTVIHRRNELRASKIMQKRALENPKIAWRWNTAVSELMETNGKLSGVRLRDVQTGAEDVLGVSGLFVAIGHVPNTRLFEGQLPIDANGYLKVEGSSTRTAVPGVFACGDCVDHVYRQAVTAAGTGCMAAIDAERYLAAQGD